MDDERKRSRPYDQALKVTVRRKKTTAIKGGGKKTRGNKEEP